MFSLGEKCILELYHLTYPDTPQKASVWAGSMPSFKEPWYRIYQELYLFAQLTHLSAHLA